jgi:hypothetical protein
MFLLAHCKYVPLIWSPGPLECTYIFIITKIKDHILITVD